MAWLLTSPDLLDGAAPQWHGRIASLRTHVGAQLDAWLLQVDDDPADLHALIARHGFNRLGRYSELLMAFFLQHLGVLHVHGLQVRAGKNETIGEFDFLLWSEVPQQGSHPALLHWEFATKYYLLESTGVGRHADYLVGPNLADSLGAKMRKILERQLALSQHPAAQVLLPQAIASAQALVKGWLFYPLGDAGNAHEKPLLPALGVADDHCRGFWRSLAQVPEIGHAHYVILPRLSWLAPALVPLRECLDHAQLQRSLVEHFAQDSLPVMIALMEEDGERAFEMDRGFIVPDDWRERANQFVQPR